MIDIHAFWRDVLSQNRARLPGYFRRDASICWHCTNERFNVAEYIRANCDYPGRWNGEIERVENMAESIVTVVRVFPADRSASFHAVSFFKLKEGLIDTLDEYWADDGEAPAWRRAMNMGMPIRPINSLEAHMNLKLIKLTKAYEKQLGEMIDEWKADQEANHTNHSPRAIFKNDYHDFDYYLTHLERETGTEDYVPDSVFFLLDEDRDRLLGAVNIRHSLNDHLLKVGGHIGDGIRPSERRKGYATAMIRLALAECKKLGIDKVLMTCNKDNIGSAKSIIKNGGVLENEVTNAEGQIEQRYWISL